MANEVTVIETQGVRGRDPARVMPPLAVQTLSIGGAVSAAFNKSTTIVTIRTTIACKIEFSALDGTDPDGNNGGEFPIDANIPHDFSVKPGAKVIAVAA